jgi:hypothetical protein
MLYNAHSRVSSLIALAVCLICILQLTFLYYFECPLLILLPFCIWEFNLQICTDQHDEACESDEVWRARGEHIGLVTQNMNTRMTLFSFSLLGTGMFFSFNTL